METFIYYGLIYFIEALIIWQYGVRMFPSKYSKSTELLWGILLYTIPFALSLAENIWLNIFSFIIINFIYILVIFKSAWHIALFHSAIVTAIMGITEILCSTFFTQFTYAFFEDALLPQNLILLAMVTKLTYHLALQIIASLFSIKNKTLSFLNLESSILILIPFVTMIVMITFALICLSVPIPTPLTLLIGTCSILLLITNIVVFAIHNYTQEKHQRYVELQLQLQKEYDLSEYYKLLIEQHENQSILIHDIKKHLNSISLLNQQKNFEKIELYINQIIHSSELDTRVQISDNEILNALLSRYIQKCQKKHIDFRSDIRKKSLHFLETNDLTALICNLMDNAFESASLQENSYIELHISRKENTPFTLLTLTNSCRTNPFSENDHKLYTRKKDVLRHGYGIKSITRIVEKYHGDIQMYYDEKSNEFHTVLTLKNLSA